MKRLLEKSRLLILVAVASTLAASATAFAWGALKTAYLIGKLVTNLGEDPHAHVALIELMDIFLIATALLIFAVGLYELFIRDVEMPEWLMIRNLHDLKAKLGSVIILVLSVTFLKHLVEWKDPQGTLFFAVSTAVVSLSLIAFSHFGGKD